MKSLAHHDFPVRSVPAIHFVRREELLEGLRARLLHVVLEEEHAVVGPHLAHDRGELLARLGCEAGLREGLRLDAESHLDAVDDHVHGAVLAHVLEDVLELLAEDALL